MSIPTDDNQKGFSSFDTAGAALAVPGVFIGGTVDARGDHDGAADPATLFTVTGTVLVRVFGYALVTIVGAGTLEVGVAGNTAGLIAQITNASTWAVNEIYLDATPTTLGVDLLANVLGPYVVVNGLDIIETLGGANLTAGNVNYVCLWRPLSPDGNVVGVVA